MYNNLLTLGPVTIHGYGLMIAIGIIAAFTVSSRRAKKVGLDDEAIWTMGLIAVIFGFVGAKLLYYLTILPDIIKDPSILKNFSGGLVIYGGIIGGLLSAWIYCRRKKYSFLSYADVVLPTVALAQGFGRIGCFLAGSCYGKVTDGPLYIVFTNSDYAPNGVHLIPTQLISSALDFLNFAVLSVIFRKQREKTGVTTVCYLLFYCTGRFIIEFFRGDLARGSVGVLSTSQFISILVAVLAVVILLLIGRKPKTAAETEETESAAQDTDK